MVRIGKLFDSSLLTADAEIFPEYEVFVRCQNAVEQGVDLLGNLKTGRTVEGMMVIFLICDAVLRSEVLPLIQSVYRSFPRQRVPCRRTFTVASALL